MGDTPTTPPMPTFLPDPPPGRPGLVVYCPNCKSTQTRQLTSGDRAKKVALIGVFAVGSGTLTKTWKCKICNYMW
jgi:hypothetical protein